MSIDSCRSVLARLERSTAALHCDLATQEDAVAKAKSEAERKRRQASSSKASSSVQTYLRMA